MKLIWFFTALLTLSHVTTSTVVEKHWNGWAKGPSTTTDYLLRKLSFETIFNSIIEHFWNNQNNKEKTKRNRREGLFFICCETTKHIVVVFSLLVKYIQLVDSTVSENKIHSFSRLSWQKEKKRNRKSNTRITKCNKYMLKCFLVVCPTPLAGWSPPARIKNHQEREGRCT